MHFGHNPFLVIISSPSGAGKSTLCKMIVQNDSSTSLSVSTTTRKRRPKEVDGKDYYFISKEDYDDLIKHDQFLEHAKIFDNFYGTPKESVNNQLENNKDVLFDIDWQGARQILEKFKKEDVLTIFILPPSIKILQERLRSRAQDSEEVVQRRMQEAKSEVSHHHEYDFILVNENLDETYQKIKSIINCHRTKRAKPQDIKSFVSNLLED
jgi:guanylate kinase